MKLQKSEFEVKILDYGIIFLLINLDKRVGLFLFALYSKRIIARHR